MIKRAKKAVESARCCWVCGKLGGAGFTSALKGAGYDVRPGEMAYAHPGCMRFAQRRWARMVVRGASHSPELPKGLAIRGNVYDHAQDYAQPQQVRGPFAFGVRPHGGGWEAWALFKPLARPDAKYSAKTTSWARERRHAVESMRVMAQVRRDG